MGQFISEMQFTSLNKEYLGREKKSISHDPNCNILSPISLRGSFNQFFYTVNWLNHYLIDVMLNTDMYFYYKKIFPSKCRIFSSVLSTVLKLYPFSKCLLKPVADVYKNYFVLGILFPAELIIHNHPYASTPFDSSGYLVVIWTRFWTTPVVIKIKKTQK